MLRGDNGIITKATETKYSSGISQFDEQTKLASMAVRTSIEANKVSKAGYIATYNGTGTDDKNYFTGLANDVAKELGVTAIAGGSGTIARGGYTVAYYLEKEGSTTQNGNGYIVIWYTDNGLRSTMDREKAITNYGLTDVASEGHKTANEAVLVTVIHVENYKSELAIKGITSLTDSDSDIGQPKFGDTTLNGQLGFSSSPTTNNTIQIVATEMSESEISEKGITRQQNGSAIIKVKQQINKEQLKAMEQSNHDAVFNMFVTALRITDPEIADFLENYSWSEFVSAARENGLNVNSVDDYFQIVHESGVGGEADNAYDFIIQTGAYADELEPLNYICDNIEKTGTDVYFELTENKEYNIVAKDESNNVVGKTSCRCIYLHIWNSTNNAEITTKLLLINDSENPKELDSIIRSKAKPYEPAGYSEGTPCIDSGMNNTLFIYEDNIINGNVLGFNSGITKCPDIVYFYFFDHHVGGDVY